MLFLDKTQEKRSDHRKNVDQLLDKINESDAILVGAASGMSSAAGHDYYYRRSETFVKWFGDFEKKYGFHNAFDGYYYCYRSREEFWAFTSTFIRLIYESKAGQPYKDLIILLQGKKYHILTTNQDTLFEQVGSPEQISAIQGDWRYFQCRHRCHDEIYYNKEQIYQMSNAIKDCKIPSELVPRCPKCGGEMEPWVRGFQFLEGEKYREEYAKCNTFLANNKDKRILFLELGVGRMTPMFIQQPFWQLTYSLPNAYYITINPKDAVLPKELDQKGWAIREDIASVLRDAVKRKAMGDDFESLA